MRAEFFTSLKSSVTLAVNLFQWKLEFVATDGFPSLQFIISLTGDTNTV